ncbi:membrane-spanning protein [Bacillus massilinigeriensis]|uniref:membrane-spanning protein n=1 Tax=Bacillus mediterraneensis TaxID=1805474 RepID=UPI0008F8F31D|nr:membrane-spanning protein [Bacillus mediterraneensis]
MKRKLIVVLSLSFIAFMIGLFVFYWMKDDQSRWQVALGGILAGGLPLVLLFMKNIPFNIPVLLGYFVSLFCTLYLGSIAGFYLKFSWWDSTLHVYKGMLVGFVAIALYCYHIPETSIKDVSRWILFLFILSLAVMSSVVWEIYEFVGDRLITHTMQRGGNKDTMYDLLCGLAGGLAVSVYGITKVRA